MNQTGEKHLTKIDVSDEDALLFLEFMKNYDTFSVLKKIGVFDVKNGKVILNFNSDGVLTKVNCDVVRYQRGLPVVVIHS